MGSADNDNFFAVRQFSNNRPAHRFENHIANPPRQAIPHSRGIWTNEFILKFHVAVLTKTDRPVCLAVFRFKPCIFTTHEVANACIILSEVSREIHDLIKETT